MHTRPTSLFQRPLAPKTVTIRKHTLLWQPPAWRAQRAERACGGAQRALQLRAEQQQQADMVAALRRALTRKRARHAPPARGRLSPEPCPAAATRVCRRNGATAARPSLPAAMPPGAALHAASRRAPASDGGRCGSRSTGRTRPATAPGSPPAWPTSQPTSATALWRRRTGRRRAPAAVAARLYGASWSMGALLLLPGHGGRAGPCRGRPRTQAHARAARACAAARCPGCQRRRMRGCRRHPGPGRRRNLHVRPHCGWRPGKRAARCTVAQADVIPALSARRRSWH